MSRCTDYRPWYTRWMYGMLTHGGFMRARDFLQFISNQGYKQGSKSKEYDVEIKHDSLPRL